MRARISDTGLGIAALALVSVLVVVSLTGGLSGLLHHEDTRTVRAVFADTQQLRVGDAVRVQGLEAGTVRSLRLGADRRTSVVTMDVDRDAGPLYADAHAVLRWHTVLGGKFYVDLQRGSAARGALAGTIPASRTARQVELDDISSVVSGGARRGLRTLPHEVTDALADPAAPARLLDHVADIAPDAATGLHALRGRQLDRDLEGLVRGAAATSRALDAPQAALQRTVQGAASTLGTIAARGDDVRAFAARSPGTLRDVATTATALDRTLGLADPLLAKLRAPAGEVAPTFRRLRPVLGAADDVATRAEPLLAALRPAVRSLAGTARNGLPVVRALEPSLTRLDRTILPYLLEIDPGTKKSTAVMIGGTFAGLAAGAGGQMDANGHFIRFPATSGSSPVNSLPCQVYIENPDAAQRIACQQVKEILASAFNYHPLGQTPGTEPAK